MNATVSLEDKQTSVLNELVSARHEEEIVHQNFFTLAKFELRSFKVKVDV